MKRCNSLLWIAMIMLFYVWLPRNLAAESTVTLYVNDCVDLNCNTTPTTTVSNMPTNDNAPSSSTGGGQGYASGEKPQLLINSLNLEQKQTSVTIKWVTSTSGISSMSWGTSTNYETGVIGETSSRYQHAATLDELMPNTRYYFKIDISDVYGNKLMYVASFVTSSIAQYSLPANIPKPTLSLQSEGLRISWINPKDQAFNSVRVIRSEYGYPKNSNDGKVLYEGKGTSFVDTTIDLQKIFYYAIFAIDASNNYSSGTLFNFNGTLNSGIPSTDERDKITILPFSSLVLIQNGKNLPVSSSIVVADGNEKLSIFLPYKNLPTKLTEAYMTIGTTSSLTLYQLDASDADESYTATIDAQTMFPGLHIVHITGSDAASTTISVTGLIGFFYPGLDNGLYTNLLWIVIMVICVDVLIIIFIELFRFIHKKKTYHEFN